jgi:hypothetical protein
MDDSRGGFDDLQMGLLVDPAREWMPAAGAARLGLR